MVDRAIEGFVKFQNASKVEGGMLEEASRIRQEMIKRGTRT